MILVDGNILDSREIEHILPSMEKRVCRTLQKPVLDPMIVVEACNLLAERFEQGEYDELIGELIKEQHIPASQIQEIVRMFKRDSLLYKLKFELGNKPEDMELSPPFHEGCGICRKRMPLGVLFHIAAGNVDGLPAYSVIEGLLTGNVNLLKLPAADHGFTVRLLSELIKLAPVLAEYIYVFDTRSNDVKAMQAMAGCADAVVIWGGDAAISSVRRLAPPNTKIIEWGHKISFAYVTAQGMDETALTGLAHHILSTKQLLCSSCQGIFVDTDKMPDVYYFCEHFFPTFNKAADEYPRPGIGIQAQLSLLLYNQELEAVSDGRRIYRGDHCSILAVPDQKLEVSFTCGNCWVKPLSKKDIIRCLHRHKGYLQTVGLLCGQEEQSQLSELFLRAGATRVTGGSDMSRMLCGETHDGEYPLQRYSKIAEYDK